MAKGGSNYTLLGDGTILEGTLRVPHSIHVNGSIKGKLDIVEDLNVGEEGVIEADIKARNAIIAGKIVGNLDAEERVELLSSSRMNGDLKTKELVIEEGAFFQGRCVMATGTNVKV